MIFKAIPVTERLPDKYGYIHVLYNNGSIADTVWYSTEKGFVDNVPLKMYKITHWLEKIED